MKAKVNYTVSTITEIIDLVDYGYEDETLFEDLTDDQKHGFLTS